MMDKINDEKFENVVGGEDVQVNNNVASYASISASSVRRPGSKASLGNGSWVRTASRLKDKDGYSLYIIHKLGSEDLAAGSPEA